MGVLDKILRDGHEVRRRKYADTGVVYMLHNAQRDDVWFKCGTGLYVSVRRMDVFTRYWCKEIRGLLLEQIKKSYEWQQIRLAKIFRADEKDPVRFACSVLQLLARMEEFRRYSTFKLNIGIC